MIFKTEIASTFERYHIFLDLFGHLRDPLKESLEKLGNQFDLVILTEYMLESLVLLADLLCIPYNVLFTKRVNSKSYDEPVTRELTPGQHRKFEKFFKQDYMMYDFFNRTLQGKWLPILLIFNLFQPSPALAIQS